MSEGKLIPQPHGGALSRGGRPKGAKSKVIAALRDALAEDSGVIAALIAKAKEGDIRAIELCLAYGIGKPTSTVEISGEGGGPVLLAPALATLSDDDIDRAERTILASAGADRSREAEESAGESVESSGETGADSS